MFSTRVFSFLCDESNTYFDKVVNNNPLKIAKMLWKKASERNVDFALFCSLEAMGARDLGKIKITYIVASKDNINLT